jgi:hypothetical protein
MTTTALPMRNTTRNGSAVGDGRQCAVCLQRLTTARARYCSPACRQRSFRLRHAPRLALDDRQLRADLRRRGTLVAHTLYECGHCGERLLGERRCPACSVFCRALGLGGRCSDCDQPILLAELLELEVMP